MMNLNKLSKNMESAKDNVYKLIVEKKHSLDSRIMKAKERMGEVANLLDVREALYQNDFDAIGGFGKEKEKGIRFVKDSVETGNGRDFVWRLSIGETNYLRIDFFKTDDKDKFIFVQNYSYESKAVEVQKQVDSGLKFATDRKKYNVRDKEIGMSSLIRILHDFEQIDELLETFDNELKNFIMSYEEYVEGTVTAF